jgi:hypothetical protein
MGSGRTTVCHLQDLWKLCRDFSSRSPSMVSRTRIQSDGCGENKKRRRSRGSLAQTAANLLLHSTNDSSAKHKQKNEDGTDRISKSSTTSTRRHSQQLPTGDRLDLENYCLHCSLGSEYRRNRLRNEIESAVKRLARRLGNNRSMAMSWEHSKDESVTSTNSAVSINTPPPDANSASHTERMHRTMTPGT